jgi:DME family drug/metabolite transporter
VDRNNLSSNEVLGIILAFGAAVCWGSAGVLYKAVIKAEYSLFQSMVYRGIIAVPFLALLTQFTTGFGALSILFQFDVLPMLFFSSLFVTSGDLFFFASLQRIDVSKSQPVASIYPLFTIIFLVVFGIEIVSLGVIGATIILIVGIGLVSQKNSSSIESSLSETGDIRQGLILSIIAAIFWSFGILSLDYLLEIPGIDVFSLATVRFGILTILMVFSWAIFDKYRLISLTDANLKESISKRDVLVFGLTGILSWGIGAVIFFSSIELIGASRATPISSINPIIAVILGVVFLKEKFSSLQGLGILLVCLGSIAISIL